MSALLHSILPDLEDDVADIILRKIESLRRKTSENDENDLLKKAIEELHSQGDITDDLRNRFETNFYVSVISGGSSSLVRAVGEDDETNNRKEFAEKWTKDRIANVLDEDNAFDIAAGIRNSVLDSEPIGTIQGMVERGAISFKEEDPNLKQDVVNSLSAMSTSDAVSSPLATVVLNSLESAEVPAARRTAAATELYRVLQIGAIAPTTTSAIQLAETGFSSSSVAITNTPANDWIAANAPTMGQEAATSVFRNATDFRIRNEACLIEMLQMIKGSGLRILDGNQSLLQRKMAVEEQLKRRGTNLSLENLFGSMDEPISNDHPTVYSPASYLVDLLQYLRNNNLDKTNPVLAPVPTGGVADDLSGTVLGHLFDRRPDLGDLELSKDNTDTIIPHVDLANEIMECFVYKLKSYIELPPAIRKAKIQAYNVPTSDSQELLAQPQNLNLDAYEILSKAVYPMTLPFNQPLLAQRSFLDFLKVNRSELVDKFRSKPPPLPADSLAARTSHLQTASGRHADAERLKLSVEEYILLTGEHFWTADHLALETGAPVGSTAYQKQVGVKTTAECWGYSQEEDLLSMDRKKPPPLGLAFVKASFLPRSGLSYSELIEVVQSRYINPGFPTGMTKKILDSIRFSYKFLDTLVDELAVKTDDKYTRLGQFLVDTKDVSDLGTIPEYDIRLWATSHFKPLGKLIVLEKGQGPRLEVTGPLIAVNNDQGAASLPEAPDGFLLTLTKSAQLVDSGGKKYKAGQIGWVNGDGGITNIADGVFARVWVTGRVTYGNPIDTNDLNNAFPKIAFSINKPDIGSAPWVIDSGYLKTGSTDSLRIAEWRLSGSLGGGSTIETVCLMHLDGSPLTLKEWDRFYKFIRIWKKLGWTVSDTDRALECLKEVVSRASSSTSSEPSGAPGDAQTSGASSISDITPELIHELGAIVQVLPKTSLSFEQLLTFWTSISNRGEQSLYHELFFVYNVKRNDPVFGIDDHGSFFMEATNRNAKISSNPLPIKAAFGLKPGELESLLGIGRSSEGLVKDVVNMKNISMIYRCTLLAKVLGLPLNQIQEVLGVIGIPFSKPSTLLQILTTWEKVNAISLPWEELGYVLGATSLGLNGLSPSKEGSLKLCKSLYQGIAEVQKSHPFITKEADATDAAVKDKASLVFDPETTLALQEFLNGTTYYTESAPTIIDEKFPALVSGILKKRIFYVPPFQAAPDEPAMGAKLQVQGIISKSKVEELRAVITQVANVTDETKKAWSNAVDMVCSQPLKFVHDTLDDILPNEVWQTQTTGTSSTLLAPDFIVVDNTETSKNQPITTTPVTPIKDKPLEQDPDSKSAQQKRYYFLSLFIPFLQARLAHKNVVDTITAGSGFKTREVARILLMDIVKVSSTNQPALNYILHTLGVAQNIWQGYICAPTDDLYKFFLPRTESGAKPDGITLEGKTWEFRADKFGNELKWSTASIPFDSQQVYTLSLSQETKSKWEWKADNGGDLIPVPKEVFNAWRGFIISPQSERYTFSVTCESQPLPLEINHRLYDFVAQIEKPQAVWTTESIRLEPAKLYSMKLRGIQQIDLSWKPSGSVRTKVPDSALLPDYAQRQLYALLEQIKRMALLFNRIPLAPDEILYIEGHRKRFDDLDFNNLTSLQHWERLYDVINLKESLPKNADQSLLNLFAWAEAHPRASADDIAQRVTASTGWLSKTVSQIMERADFSTGRAEDFVNEKVLLSLVPMIEFVKRVDIPVSTLYEWASAPIIGIDQFTISTTISRDIQQAARTKFDLKTWPQAVRPVNDILRDAQKNALISYLLAQQEFVDANNIIDADSLFEFFLIDVQATPLVETSRIKQAISSVQLFIQRCMFGLEADRGVDANALDRARWEWMQKYRLWEANRKVFLYPENWIDPSLRDGKTEIFKQLEAGLLQRNLTSETVGRAVKDFLYEVDHISNMQAIGTFVDYRDGNKIHIISRTRGSPYGYYHNWFMPGVDGGTWNGWEKIEVDIPHYTSPSDGSTGNYVSPVVYNGRLLLFIAHFTPQTEASSKASGTPEGMRQQEFKNMTPISSWEIRLAWTEKRDGKWTPKKMCAQPFRAGEYTKNMALAATAARAAYIQTYDEVKKAYTDAGTAPSEEIRTAWNDTEKKMTSLIDAERCWGYRSAFPTPLQAYIFIPALVQPGDSTSDTSVANSIRIYLAAQDIPYGQPSSTIDGCWLYNGTELLLMSSTVGPTAIEPQDFASKTMNFGQRYDGSNTSVPSLRSYQAFLRDQPNQKLKLSLPLLATRLEIYSHDSLFSSSNAPNTGGTLTFLNPSNNTILTETIFHGYMSSLLHAAASGDDAMPIIEKLSKIEGDNSLTSFGLLVDGSQDFRERRTMYSIYNWELGLHAPMILIDRLFREQQFEQARKVCHYIFNPLSPGNSTDMGRFWIFPPFKQIATESIESIFMKYGPGAAREDVKDWRDNPFKPHVVARARLQSYMKWIVMKYIEILIAHGDLLFRQETSESISAAIQLYVLASHIYGPRGQKVPRAKVRYHTYNTLSKEFDAFSNAIVQIEPIFPFSNQTPLSISKLPGDADAHLANIFGSAGALYFAIPDNPNVRALASLIDDRLFKIRNSQDMNGVFRRLPLFEPPIDPSLLVRAAAQGLSLGNVLTDINGPMPSCRFLFMLHKALDLAAETRSLGQALLSIKEKKDGEMLGALRAKHETHIQTMLMNLKKLVVDEAKASLSVLEYNRKSAVSRLTFYMKQIGQNLSGVPELDKEFNELDSRISTPIEDGGLALSPFEKEEMDRYQIASNLNIAVGSMETAAGLLYALPNVDAQGMPLGIGVSVKFGPSNLAALSSAIAKGLSIGVENLNFQASSAGRKAQSQRMLQDRILQANAAGYETSSIDKQITAAKIRIGMASAEIDQLQTQINQSREAEEFLHSKYTNSELYSWLDGSTKTLFYQTYSQAFALAAKAEKAFKFEKPQAESTSYIQSGYWDPSRDGLMAGDNLYMALKNLETAYMEKRGHDYQITKAVSLRRLDPVALLTLKSKGSCSFSVPEILYDMDFPGHYLRRIRSVAITIPCVAGPYTSLNATLRMTSSKYRKSPKKGMSYAESLALGADLDPRFSSVTVPISAIAVCSGQHDEGVFDLKFEDDAARYQPFEGAGAISDWSLELPPYSDYAQFSYETISDVVLHIRYTSVEGGSQLRTDAINSVNTFFTTINKTAMSGLVTLFDLKNDFATQWSHLIQMSNASNPAGPSILELPSLWQRLPIFTSGCALEKIEAEEIWVMTDQPLTGTLALNIGTEPTLALTGSGEVGKYHKYSGKVGKPFGKWKLEFGIGKIKATKCWMMVKYHFIQAAAPS